MEAEKSRDADDGKPSKTFRIRSLRVKEASFVKRGANQHAKVLLWKSADGEPQSPPSFLTKFADAIRRLFKMDAPAGEEHAQPPTTSEILEEQDFWMGWYRLRDAFDAACRGVMDSEAEGKAELLQQSALEFVEGLKALLPSATGALSKAFDVAALPEGVSPNDAITAIKKTLDLVESEANAPARPVPDGEGEPMAKIVAKSLAELLPQLDDESRAAIQSEMDKAKAPVAKADNPELSKLSKALDEANAERVTLSKRLADMEDKARTAELRGEFSGNSMSHPGLSQDEAVKLLKAQSPENAELLRKSFKAAAEVEKQSALLKGQIGAATGETFADDSAEALLQKKAEELRKSDPNAFKTINVAKAHVLGNDKDLAEAVRTERSARN